MVTSTTALRTHIRQRYGVSANKTLQGLFVPLRIDKISEEDIILYKVKNAEHGTLWSLPSENAEILFVKPLPRTPSAFLHTGLSKKLFQIKESKTYTNTYPETIEHLTRLSPYHSGYGTYTCYTIKLLYPDESLLQNLTYTKTEDPDIYRVYLCTAKSRTKQVSLTNTLIAMLTFFLTSVKSEDLEQEWSLGFARFGTIADIRRALEQGTSLQLLLASMEEWQ